MSVAPPPESERSKWVLKKIGVEYIIKWNRAVRVAQLSYPTIEIKRAALISEYVWARMETMLIECIETHEMAQRALENWSDRCTWSDKKKSYSFYP